MNRIGNNLSLEIDDEILTLGLENFNGMGYWVNPLNDQLIKVQYNPRRGAILRGVYDPPKRIFQFDLFLDDEQMSQLERMHLIQQNTAEPIRLLDGRQILQERSTMNTRPVAYGVVDHSVSGWSQYFPVYNCWLDIPADLFPSLAGQRDGSGFYNPRFSGSELRKAGFTDFVLNGSATGTNEIVLTNGTSQAGAIRLIDSYRQTPWHVRFEYRITGSSQGMGMAFAYVTSTAGIPGNANACGLPPNLGSGFAVAIDTYDHGSLGTPPKLQIRAGDQSVLTDYGESNALATSSVVPRLRQSEWAVAEVFYDGSTVTANFQDTGLIADIVSPSSGFFVVVAGTTSTTTDSHQIRNFEVIYE